MIYQVVSEALQQIGTECVDLVVKSDLPVLFFPIILLLHDPRICILCFYIKAGVHNCHLLQNYSFAFTNHFHYQNHLHYSLDL